MKTPYEVLETSGSQWEQDEYGIRMQVNGVEVRIEPLLFGGAYLAVYQLASGEPILVGEKMPITLGTPGQRRGTP